MLRSNSHSAALAYAFFWARIDEQVKVNGFRLELCDAAAESAWAKLGW